MSTTNDAAASASSAVRPRLALRRERVKSLRVHTGVQTGGTSTGDGKGCGQGSGSAPIDTHPSPNTCVGISLGRCP